MGMRGPAPLPSNVLKMRGTEKATRAREQTVPKVADQLKPPTGMPAPVRKIWKGKVDVYTARGMDLSGCGGALAQFCYLEHFLSQQWKANMAPQAAMISRHTELCAKFYDVPAAKTNVLGKPNNGGNPFEDHGKPPDPTGKK